jgi:DNA polymerase III subunit epsilon
VSLSFEDAVALLSAHPDYRVLKRLDPEAVGRPPLTAEGTVRRAAIVDTETTGMNAKMDRVIELGIVVFEYVAETGAIGPVVGSLSALEDPGIPIPPEVAAIHHITDDMVKGKRIDDAVLAQLLEGVSLVIAHNAKFDRPFLEARFPLFMKMPWACSIRDVEWRDSGYASSALEFLAYRTGFFYDGHRAEIDCRALLAVLARPLGNKTETTALKMLLDHAREKTSKIFALNSPFASKDLLKARGYRWEPDGKVWALELDALNLDAELAFLKETVFVGTSTQVELETQDARVRYSERKGKTERISL